MKWRIRLQWVRDETGQLCFAQVLILGATTALLLALSLYGTQFRSFAGDRLDKLRALTGKMDSQQLAESFSEIAEAASEVSAEFLMEPSGTENDAESVRQATQATADGFMKMTRGLLPLGRAADSVTDVAQGVGEDPVESPGNPPQEPVDPPTAGNEDPPPEVFRPGSGRSGSGKSNVGAAADPEGVVGGDDNQGSSESSSEESTVDALNQAAETGNTAGTSSLGSLSGVQGNSGQGYPGQGYPGQGYPGQGYPGQGYPGQGYPGQGYPGQGYPGQGYPGQGYPGQGYPGQGYPGQGYPGQGYPGQGDSGQGDSGQGNPTGGSLPPDASLVISEPISFGHPLRPEFSTENSLSSSPSAGAGSDDVTLETPPDASVSAGSMRVNLSASGEIAAESPEQSHPGVPADSDAAQQLHGGGPAIEVIGVDRSDPEKPRLRVRVHRDFQQLQVWVENERRGFQSPRVRVTQSIAITPEHLQPGRRIELIGIEQGGYSRVEYTVPAISIDMNDVTGADMIPPEIVHSSPGSGMNFEEE